MAQKLNQLSAVEVAKASQPGSLFDGGGLRLQVTVSGKKSWTFRYKLKGQCREMGLGSYPAVSLQLARQKAADARAQLADEKDPIKVRDAARAAEAAAEAEAAAQAALAEVRRKTFRQVAEAYITEQERGWKNPKKLATSWRGTLARHAYPVIGDLPVAAIDTGLVLQVLQPLWGTKTETAQRVRMRIENILAAATVLGYREGANPAVWRGILDRLLQPARKVSPVEHRPSLPYAALPTFMTELRAREALAARALELLILTATRTSEVLEAEWTEFDLTAKVWVIPAARMKMGKEHRVPLSPAAVALLEGLRQEQRLRPSPFLFPGGKAGKPLSNMALLVLLRRMEKAGFTVHGFRSTFRDWAAEQTTFPHEICETALAHRVGDEATRAYLRSDQFAKRRTLMEEWARYCLRKVTTYMGLAAE